MYLFIFPYLNTVSVYLLSGYIRLILPILYLSYPN